MSKNDKTIGILGGMGPYATASFYKKILDLTNASKDWEHFHVIIDCNPHIPSRSRHYLFHEDSPVPGMIDCCKRLEQYPVDFIVIPCNSASFFLEDIKKYINVPILNIMEITVRSLVKQYPCTKSVAVFGGVITYENMTYRKYLEKNNIKYIHHDRETQAVVEQLIEKIKLNDISQPVVKEFKTLVAKVKNKHNIDVVILGCTEFGCMTDFDSEIPLVDSSTELARYTVLFAKNAVE